MSEQLHEEGEAQFVVVLDNDQASGNAREILTAPRPGVITIQTAPMELQEDAADLLGALGLATGDDASAARANAGVWQLAASWCLARGLRRVVFLGAERFTTFRWDDVVWFYLQTNITVLLFYAAGRLPGHAAGALEAIHHSVAADADEALALLRPGPEPRDSALLLDGIARTAPDVPAGFPTVPRSAFARFRTDAYDALKPAPFAAFDAQYRYGMRAACAWICRQAEYTDATAPRALLAPELLPQYLTPHEAESASRFLSAAYGERAARTVFEGLLCVGRDPSPHHRYPFAWRDKAALQLFLSALVLDVAQPEASVTRVRGAQAGFLLHGLLLAVPDHLHDQRGPGLTTAALTAHVCSTLAAQLPYPIHAARAALTLLTGLGKDFLGGIRLASIDEHGASVTADARYAVPAAARPLINAARTYRRLEAGAREDAFLLTAKGYHSCGKSCATLIDEAIRATGTDPPQPATAPRASTPWHTPSHLPWHAQAACWFVAEPLHGPRARHSPDHGRTP